MGNIFLVSKRCLFCMFYKVGKYTCIHKKDYFFVNMKLGVW